MIKIENAENTRRCIACGVRCKGLLTVRFDPGINIHLLDICMACAINLRTELKKAINAKYGSKATETELFCSHCANVFHAEDQVVTQGQKCLRCGEGTLEKE